MKMSKFLMLSMIAGLFVSQQVQSLTQQQKEQMKEAMIRELKDRIPLSSALGEIEVKNTVNLVDTQYTLDIKQYLFSVGNNNKNTNQLWLTMTVNNKSYVLARAANAGSNAPTSPYLDHGYSTSADTGYSIKGQLAKAIESLSVSDWQNGVYFTFAQGVDSNVYLIVLRNASALNAIGLVAQAQIPGISRLSDIQGNVLFGGSYLQDAISINPFNQALVLTTVPQSFGSPMSFNYRDNSPISFNYPVDGAAKRARLEALAEQQRAKFEAAQKAKLAALPDQKAKLAEKKQKASKK